MKQKLIPFVAFLLLHSMLSAQTDMVSGARSYGLAGASLLLNDLWSTNNNPAGLGFQKKWAAGISYENQFLQSELSNQTAVVSYPTSVGAFGLSLNQFGYSAYQENRVGLSYGQQLGENLAIGVQLNYLSTNLGEGYGSTSAISGNIGVLAKINDEFSMAAQVVNPNRAQLVESTDERYPTLLKLGLGYSFSEKVTLVSEVVKDIDFDANVKFGIEYQAIPLLHFRVGYASTPSLSSFGFGLNLERFKLDFASGFDANFGFSPQVSLHYTPKNSE